MAVGGAGAGIVASQVSWNFKNIMYETTDFVNTPIRTNISRLTNEKLGGIGVMMQMSITQMQQAVEAHRKMVATAEEMDEQAQKLASGKKFAVDGMNLDEVKSAWLEGEEAFLEYRKELNSVLPDNVALGRSYFANANILTPLSFSTAISAAKTEVTLVEDRISNLEFRMKKEGQLSESDQQLLKAAYADLELNKRKMGTTLALVRVYQLFYPEHARPSWSDNPKKGNPFMNQYGEILDGLGFEYYAQEYNRELKEQLSALGLQISGADINAVARRQKVLVDKIGELSRN